MIFTMYALYTNPVARFLARILRHCIVSLSTGKEIVFNKNRHYGSCNYDGYLSKTEEQEYIHAMMLIGI